MLFHVSTTDRCRNRDRSHFVLSTFDSDSGTDPDSDFTPPALRILTHFKALSISPHQETHPVTPRWHVHTFTRSGRTQGSPLQSSYVFSLGVANPNAPLSPHVRTLTRSGRTQGSPLQSFLVFSLRITNSNGSLPTSDNRLRTALTAGRVKFFQVVEV